MLKKTVNENYCFFLGFKEIATYILSCFFNEQSLVFYVVVCQTKSHVKVGTQKKNNMNSNLFFSEWKKNIDLHTASISFSMFKSYQTNNLKWGSEFMSQTFYIPWIVINGDIRTCRTINPLLLGPIHVTTNYKDYYLYYFRCPLTYTISINYYTF